jgi:hypothetical protein
MNLCSDLGTSFLFHLMPLLTFTSIHCMLLTSLTVGNSMISYFWQYHSTVQRFCDWLLKRLLLTVSRSFINVANSVLWRMAIILKANKVNLCVPSVLFVFWYHSPNLLDTPHIYI